MQFGCAALHVTGRRKLSITNTMEQAESQRGGYQAAQAWTGIKRGTLHALVSQKRIPHYRVGPRLVIFDRIELEAWLAAGRVERKAG